MPFQSEISPRTIIIDDTNFSQVVSVDPQLHGRGRIPPPKGFSSAVTSPFEGEVPIIPKSEWDDRIEEMERTKTRLSDLIQRSGVEVKDQNGTNYCWINAPTWTIEVTRAIQGEPHRELSPASVGAKIKRFRNVGGWGTEGLEYIAEHGVVPETLWPANAINRRYDTPEAWEEAKKYRCLDWAELPADNLEVLFSYLFARIPVAVGYNWWSHEVTAVDPVKLSNGRYGLRIGNSWGAGWSDNGYGVLTGRKMYPDDAVAPRSVVPTFQ